MNTYFFLELEGTGDIMFMPALSLDGTMCQRQPNPAFQIVTGTWHQLRRYTQTVVVLPRMLHAPPRHDA